MLRGAALNRLELPVQVDEADIPILLGLLQFGAPAGQVRFCLLLGRLRLLLEIGKPGAVRGGQGRMQGGFGLLLLGFPRGKLARRILQHVGELALRRGPAGRNGLLLVLLKIGAGGITGGAGGLCGVPGLLHRVMQRRIERGEQVRADGFKLLLLGRTDGLHLGFLLGNPGAVLGQACLGAALGFLVAGAGLGMAALLGCVRISVVADGGANNGLNDHVVCPF